MENRDERNDIPSITIIMDVPPAPPDPSTEPSLYSTPCFLSPSSKSYGCPSPDLSGTSTTDPPPSPTLSNYSTHFPTILRLRDNKPEDISGFSSLVVLDAQFSYGTKLDLHPLYSSEKHLNDAGRESKVDGEKKKGKDDDDDDDLTAHQLELSQDQAIDPRPFRFKPFQLAHMLDPKNFKNFDALQSFGGIDGLLRGLGTDSEHGLSSKDVSTKDLPEIVLTEPSGNVGSPTEADDGAAFQATMDDRRRVFGENLLPTRISKTLLQLMWAALKDKVLILLSIAAIVSLALGLFQDFGTHRPPGEPPVDWVEGVAIMIAIAIVVIVGSVNDWKKERQFKALNERKEERGVKVIRDGVEKVVDIKEVVVGDIALVEPGEIVPCDGIFISGHNVKCDESGATGESDAIKKVSYQDVLELQRKNRAAGQDPNAGHTDCFVISGSKVLEGVGKYVVVAVGTKSFNGRIMMALRGDTENTPLQLKLNNLAELIAQLGSAAGAILFTALMIRFFVQLGQGVPPRNANENGIAFVNILIIAVTLIVVAVPEGLPLAVTLALAFGTKRMTYENLLVRVLGSCETMANSSVICTDKTGTPTQNSMTVVAGSTHTPQNKKIVTTLSFNAFVFAQIFNSINCRRLDSTLNIFEVVTKNRIFIGITLLEIVVQILIVFVGGAAFQVTRIGGREWGIALTLGVVSIPWGAAILLMPSKPFEKAFKFIGLIGKPEVLPTVRPDADGRSGAINLVRDNLRTFSNIRGGRLRSSSFVIKSRSARLSPHQQVGVSSMLAMAPTLLLRAVAASQVYLQLGLIPYYRPSRNLRPHSDPLPWMGCPPSDKDKRWEWGISLAHAFPGKFIKKAFTFLRRLANIRRDRLGYVSVAIKSRSLCEQMGRLPLKAVVGSVHRDARRIKNEVSVADGKPQICPDVPPDDPMPKQFSEHSTSFQIILFNLNLMMKY